MIILSWNEIKISKYSIDRAYLLLLVEVPVVQIEPAAVGIFELEQAVASYDLEVAVAALLASVLAHHEQEIPAQQQVRVPAMCFLQTAW